jgi:DNA-binding MarR family transcriptional regulator
MPAPRFLLELWLANQVAGGLIGDELEAAGIQPHLFGLLSHIAGREPVAPSVIAAEERIPVTTIRDNVQRLVDRGLVERVPNPDDRRSYLLVRTAKGASLLQVGDAVIARIYAGVEPRLPRPAGEYEAMLRELQAALRGAPVSRPAGAPSRRARA